MRKDAGNPYADHIRGRRANAAIADVALRDGQILRKRDLDDINEYLVADTERAGIVVDVWTRVAQIDGGIVIHLGDENHTRIQITAGKVQIVTAGCDILFCRSTTMSAMCIPAPRGNFKLLDRYLGNLDPVSQVLLKVWMCYTLAQPKIPTTKYPILVLQGGQGSGKSTLCALIQQLLDPSTVGLQMLPSNPRDLAIAAQVAHVLFFDNVRGFSSSMADTFCIAATGGALARRQLYTDADQQVIYLHVALVINGIHDFITQPDLAQRCLPLQLNAIPEGDRQSEAELFKNFQEDLPAILRGLFDLIARVFLHLPDVKVTNPERMIDFSRWLAAMELVTRAPAGVYQAAYGDAIQQGQRDSLLSNPLAAAVLEFAEKVDGTYSGTPSELLRELNAHVERETQRSRDWPSNAIALSKRLLPMQGALLSQGIRLELHRGKTRTITIKTEGPKNENY